MTPTGSSWKRGSPLTARMSASHGRRAPAGAPRDPLGIALAGADGTAWYLRAGGDDRLPRWFTRTDRPLIGHDLKPLHTMLLQRGVELSGADRDTLVASYMLNPALRAQSIDDLAAQRFGAELPPAAVTPESGSEEPAVARRAAGVALTALLVAPTLMTELEGGEARRPLRGGRDAAPTGPGPDGDRRRAHRPRCAARDVRRVRRAAGRARNANLRIGRPRVQHRFARASSRPSCSTSWSCRPRSGRRPRDRPMHRSSRSSATGTTWWG